MYHFNHFSPYYRFFSKWGGLCITICMISCRTESYSPTPPLTAQRDVGLLVTIPQSRIPLYADLSCYNLSGSESVDTKSVDEDTLVSLGSLLDLNAEKCYENGGIQYSQIPFSDNSDGRWSSYLYDNEIEYGEEGVSSSIRKFYVQTQKGDAKQSFIVTMITYNEYETRFPDYDYVNKPNYSGLILFSTVTGKLVTIRSYNNGQIFGAKILSPDSLHTDSLSVVHYAAFVDGDGAPQTKTIYATLPPSYCIAYVINPSWCWGDYYNNGAYSGVGGNCASMYQQMMDALNEAYLDPADDNLPLDWENPPEEESFTVSLTCNVPREIDMVGNGSYTEGTWVYIGYERNGDGTSLVLDLSFQRWVGDFSSINVPCFLYKSSRDIESTAYFNDGTEYPCRDSVSRKMNPLKEMSVAPSNQYGNYLGGTFGMTRKDAKGNPIKHEGLDLAAVPGTPVFAMFTGEITDIKTDAPDKYVARSYGNRIRISSKVIDSNDTTKIQSISVLYAHLQYQNAVGRNPRTGRQFDVGDLVYQGELIGYSGKTGNAYNVSVKHLHLGVKNDGSWVDPAPYINGTINVSAQGAITGIKCHDGYSNYVEIDLGDEESADDDESGDDVDDDVPDDEVELEEEV